ncbi:putative IKI3 IkappaB kinase complex protein [Hamiltosporidium tvaerminnensis]|uniref:Putative IKI3 IkappaB kinase complex protein n=1 Tax=Hamiltosporidium tvaerminnensis TaxID=1176355 RepID=A0A4Q9LZZ9_9MICR|nr:putative IKI3 IkappaB kinase complex protein [Hamiltosporidium tvaerminnensis]
MENFFIRNSKIVELKSKDFLYSNKAILIDNKILSISDLEIFCDLETFKSTIIHSNNSQKEIKNENSKISEIIKSKKSYEENMPNTELNSSLKIEYFFNSKYFYFLISNTNSIFLIHKKLNKITEIGTFEHKIILCRFSPSQKYCVILLQNKEIYLLNENFDILKNTHILSDTILPNKYIDTNHIFTTEETFVNLEWSDQNKFAIIFNTQILIYNTELENISVSLNFKPTGSISWNSKYNTFALSSPEIIYFIEPNGLLHHSPLKTHNTHISYIDSNLLLVFNHLKEFNEFKIFFLSNFKWYLKIHKFVPKTQKFLSIHKNIIFLKSENKIIKYYFYKEITSQDTQFGVINGKNIYFYNYQNKIIPPPFSSSSISLSYNVIDICFSNHKIFVLTSTINSEDSNTKYELDSNNPLSIPFVAAINSEDAKTKCEVDSKTKSDSISSVSTINSNDQISIINSKDSKDISDSVLINSSSLISPKISYFIETIKIENDTLSIDSIITIPYTDPCSCQIINISNKKINCNCNSTQKSFTALKHPIITQKIPNTDKKNISNTFSQLLVIDDTIYLKKENSSILKMFNFQNSLSLLTTNHLFMHKNISFILPCIKTMHFQIYLHKNVLLALINNQLHIINIEANTITNTPTSSTIINTQITTTFINTPTTAHISNTPTTSLLSNTPTTFTSDNTPTATLIPNTLSFITNNTYLITSSKHTYSIYKLDPLNLIETLPSDNTPYILCIRNNTTLISYIIRGSIESLTPKTLVTEKIKNYILKNKYEAAITLINTYSLNYSVLFNNNINIKELLFSCRIVNSKCYYTSDKDSLMVNSLITDIFLEIYNMLDKKNNTPLCNDCLLGVIYTDYSSMNNRCGGVNDKGVDIKGVNDKGSDIKGVNEGEDMNMKLRGVNNKDSDIKDVNISSNKQQGVGNSSNIKGVNTTSDEQHPFNNLSNNYHPLNTSPITQHPLNTPYYTSLYITPFTDINLFIFKFLLNLNKIEDFNSIIVILHFIGKVDTALIFSYKLKKLKNCVKILSSYLSYHDIFREGMGCYNKRLVIELAEYCNEYPLIYNEVLKGNIDMVEGVNNISSVVKGVKDKGDCKGVNNTTNEQQGVNNLSDIQHPFNKTTNEQHPSSNTTNDTYCSSYEKFLINDYLGRKEISLYYLLLINDKIKEQEYIKRNNLYISSLKYDSLYNEVGDLTGDNDIGDCKGFNDIGDCKGVNDKEYDIKGVNNSINKQQGVNNTSNCAHDQQGVTNNTPYKQHPLNNSTNEQHPLNNSTNEQHPLNYNTIQHPLNNNNEQHPLNNNTIQHPLNNTPYIYNPLFPLCLKKYFNHSFYISPCNNTPPFINREPGYFYNLYANTLSKEDSYKIYFKIKNLKKTFILSFENSEENNNNSNNISNDNISNNINNKKITNSNNNINSSNITNSNNNIDLPFTFVKVCYSNEDIQTYSSLINLPLNNFLCLLISYLLNNKKYEGVGYIMKRYFNDKEECVYYFNKAGKFMESYYIIKGYSYSREIEGVNIDSSNYRGVNIDSSNYKGVNIYTNEQQGVNKPSDKQYGVNISTNEQQGVNNNNSIQQGVNIDSSNYRGVNNDNSNYRGVNDNNTIQQGVNIDSSNNRGVNDNNTIQQGVNGISMERFVVELKGYFSKSVEEIEKIRISVNKVVEKVDRLFERIQKGIEMGIGVDDVSISSFSGVSEGGRKRGIGGVKKRVDECVKGIIKWKNEWKDLIEVMGVLKMEKEFNLIEGIIFEVERGIKRSEEVLSRIEEW